MYSFVLSSALTFDSKPNSNSYYTVMYGYGNVNVLFQILRETTQPCYGAVSK